MLKKSMQGIAIRKKAQARSVTSVRRTYDNAVTVRSANVSITKVSCGKMSIA